MLRGNQMRPNGTQGRGMENISEREAGKRNERVVEKIEKSRR